MRLSYIAPMKKNSKEKTGPERVLFECTPKFKRLLKRKAKKSGLSMSAYIRQVVLAAEV